LPEDAVIEEDDGIVFAPVRALQNLCELVGEDKPRNAIVDNNRLVTVHLYICIYILIRYTCIYICICIHIYIYIY